MIPEFHRRFTLEGKSADLYAAAQADSPLIVCNGFPGEGEKILQALRGEDLPPFSLAAVSGLIWERDLSPWPAPPVSGGGCPFSGGAEEYLELLTGEILPRLLEQTAGTPPWLGLAGYSMAGLFAVYALYRTPLFARSASMSGSLWFPGFLDYARSHPPAGRPQALFLSLGEREHRTGDPVLRTVRTATEALAEHWRRSGVPTEYRRSPGGHFTDSVGRCARGIAWLLREKTAGLSPENLEREA